jgi:hypothetical protein
MKSRWHVFGWKGDVEFSQNCLSMLQKSKEHVPTQMHDFTNGDNNNDDPPLAKNCKFQLPSMS